MKGSPASWTTCGLGTAPLGSTAGGPLWWGEQDRTTAIRTVRAALDAGITWIDTAPFYGWGRAEEIVGEALAGRGDDVIVLTKCGTVRSPDGKWAEDGSPAAVRADVEASLGRLRIDHIDVVQLHDPDPEVPVEETVGSPFGGRRAVPTRSSAPARPTRSSCSRTSTHSTTTPPTSSRPRLDDGRAEAHSHALYGAAMTMPEEPHGQVDTALEEAWNAANHCMRLLDQNNVTTAVAYANAAQAWASIASATATARGRQP